MYSLNLKEQICTGIFTINDDDPYKFYPMAGLGGKCFEWEGKIVITPAISNKLQVYDVEKTEWKSWSIDCIGSELQISRIFVGSLINNCLYFLGCHYPLFIKFNLQNQSIESSDMPYRKYIDREWEKYPYFWRYGSRRYSSELYLNSAIDDEILGINFEKDDWFWCNKEKIIEKNCESYESICRELEPGIIFEKQFIDGRKVIQTNDGMVKTSTFDGKYIEFNLFDEEKRMNKEINELLNTDKWNVFIESQILNESQIIGLNEFLMLVR